jgi:hypothetical protein
LARQRPKPPTPHLPEPVRRAVERTVESTRGSARSTRGRAQDLVDDATRIFEHQAEAAAAVPDRVRGALGDLRFATREELRRLRERIDSLQDRVDSLEGKPKRRTTAKAKAKPRTASAKAKPRTASAKAKPKTTSTRAKPKTAARSASKTTASKRRAPSRSTGSSKKG